MPNTVQTIPSGGPRQPGKPEFSLAHLTILGCPPPEATYIAARAGYDYVSIRTIFMGLPNEPNYSLASNPAMLRETKAALAETGIKGLDVELARIVDDVDVKTYMPELEAAAELGIRQVVSSVWATDREYMVNSLTELCGLASKIGLTVNLEFVTWTPVSTLQQAVSIIREVNQPNCGLLVDTLHFRRSRVGLEELDAIPSAWFHMVHLCDALAEIPSKREELIYTAREARLDPGEGGIDLAAILNRIPEVPYSLEIPNFERLKRMGYAEHARLSLANAKKYFAGHPREAQPRDR
jgi:sugar phosphate isomerase/epimerase